MNDTKTQLQRRVLHFTTVDDILKEMDRIIASERAGTLRHAGNWTAGQTFGHLAAWINFGWEGYPPATIPPWPIKVIAKLFKNMFLHKPMRPGMKLGRIPGGTVATELMSTEEGARKLREAIGHLQRREEPKFHSPALGPMTLDERIALNLRHAELHLGFQLP